MSYYRVLVIVSVVLFLGGLASVLTAMPQDLNLDLDNLGKPQPESLKRLCLLYETAKQDLVQLNSAMHDTISGFRRTLGGHGISIGIVTWLLRTVTDPNTQKQILKAFLISAAIAFAFSVHQNLPFTTAEGESASPLRWLPFVFQILVMGLFSSGLIRLRKAES